VRLKCRPLRDGLKQKFPGFRIAGLADYLPEDIARHKQNFAGDPCLSVASADVDGDGVKDFALIITDASLHALLVGARDVPGKEWAISTLSDFGSEAPGRLYVASLKPGAYQDIHAAAEVPTGVAPEGARVPSYTAPHQGFVGGAIGATRVAYFFTGKRWVHLWLSD